MARSRPGGGDGDSDSPDAARNRQPGGGRAADVEGQENIVSDVAARGRSTADGGTGGQPAAGGEDGPQTAGTTTPDPAARAFVDGIAGDPTSVAGRSAQDIADQFRAAGYDATVEQSTKKGTSGNAVQVRVAGHPEITNIQVHPGGGRHTPEGSAYWKISTSTAGKTWVIPGDFRGADDLGGNVVRYDE
ncbi:hypothetical protein [Paractinoplanes rishiriensis]|uniref:Uncharacterized protein n=1 Tax=Paractinoplanes rishiriensis TaxID=1050105 RepID=A0A919K9Q3_9ACTN|nr:hypothetical protein [Actinoplanes rishiriensis]GIF02018.1 hypothetical protein Ari01nite_94820 [Actinoplanes rishiriensis]